MNEPSAPSFLPWLEAIQRLDASALEAILAQPALRAGLCASPTQPLQLLLSSWPSNDLPGMRQPPLAFDRCLVLILQAMAQDPYHQALARDPCHAEWVEQALQQVVWSGYHRTITTVSTDPSVRAVFADIDGSTNPRRIHGRYLLEQVVLESRASMEYPFQKMVVALLAAGLRPGRPARSRKRDEGPVFPHGGSGDTLRMVMAKHPGDIRRPHPEMGAVCALLCAHGATADEHTLRAAIPLGRRDLIELTLSHGSMDRDTALSVALELLGSCPEGSALVQQVLLEASTAPATSVSAPSRL